MDRKKVAENASWSIAILVAVLITLFFLPFALMARAVEEVGKRR